MFHGDGRPEAELQAAKRPTSGEGERNEKPDRRHNWRAVRLHPIYSGAVRAPAVGVMMPTPRPVTIRGVTYSSAREAASALGVSYSAVIEGRRRGRLDSVGLRHSTVSKPVTVGNMSFPSRKAASKALGAGKTYVSEVMNNPTEKRMRGLAQRLAQYAKEQGIDIET